LSAPYLLASEALHDQLCVLVYPHGGSRRRRAEAGRKAANAGQSAGSRLHGVVMSAVVGSRSAQMRAIGGGQPVRPFAQGPPGLTVLAREFLRAIRTTSQAICVPVRTGSHCMVLYLACPTVFDFVLLLQVCVVALMKWLLAHKILQSFLRKDAIRECIT
jgi:hypothetical protein